MYYTLAAAAAATGLSENTILKAVEGGAITGTKDLFGEWRIERDELHRSHAPVAQGNTESGAARSPAASDSADLETEIEALIKKAGNALRQQADQPPPARDSGRSIACQFPAVSTGQPEAATKSIQALLRLRRGAGARFIPRDRIGAAVPERDSAWGDHVRARVDEVFVPIATPASKRLRAGLVAAALLGALGVGWVSGRGWYPDAGSPSTPVGQNLNASTPVPRPETEALRIMTPKADRTAVPSAPNSRKIVAQPNSNSPGQATPVPQQTKNFPRPTPTPETRPTTIDGWTVREVAGGKVVLEGPNGIWTAARGDTVPGVGKVDSIVLWGNRWIVATSRGLITTE